MKVIFTGAGPGDPKLLTVKAKELLENCEVCIYAGSLIPPEVIALIPSSAEKHDSAGMSLDDMVVVYKDAQQRGVDVVRLHTGEPAIFGAILEQMNELDELGIEYEQIAGVSSFQAAAAALKAELTAPEVSQTVILSRIAGRTPVPDEQDLAELAKTKSTLCLFLSVGNMQGVVDKLTPFYGQDCPAAVVYHASWKDELVVKATLATIAAEVEKSGIKKTAIIVVGHALRREQAVSKLYDKTFSHGYRKGDR